MTVCNLKAVQTNLSKPKMHILISGTTCYIYREINKNKPPEMDFLSCSGSILIFVFNFFLEMAFDQFDEGFIPICISRLGISTFWGVVWLYLVSFTNVLPAFIYFTAFLVVYVQYKMNKNQEANAVCS